MADNTFDQFDVVDLPMLKEDLREKINKAAWKYGADIVPSIYYRAFLFDGAFDSDDESTYRMWLLKDVAESEASAKAIAEEEAEAAPAEGEGSDAPAGGEGEGEGEGEAPAEAAELPEISPKRYAALALNSKVALEITPSEALIEKFPYANVVIDGKEYAGLSILNNPLEFFMDRDHKVVIDWHHGKVYESFRIVVNR